MEKQNKKVETQEVDDSEIIALYSIVVTFMILLMIVFFFMIVDHIRIKRNMKLCAFLNGTEYTYALDQPEFLCKIPNGDIIDLDKLEPVNITKLIRGEK